MTSGYGGTAPRPTACLTTLGPSAATCGCSAGPATRPGTAADQPGGCPADPRHCWQVRETRRPGDDEFSAPGCTRACLGAATGSSSWAACHRRTANHRSGWLARSGAVGVVLWEPVGPPEGLPHQDLLAVDALERAGGAPHCCHRDHHILVLLWLVSHDRARARRGSRSRVACLLPIVGWLSRSEWTPLRFALRRLAPHGTDAVFLTAFLR